MNPIRAVLFDYGMVLSAPPDPAAWARMLSISGLSEETLHREYWAHRHAYDSGELTAESYWNQTAAGGGIVLTARQLTDLIAADTDLWSQINTPMLEWAQSLQRAGIPTGVLSNIGDGMSAGLTQKHAWLANFHHRTWSHALRSAKPDTAIYLHAAKGLHTAPTNILFIDDKAENVAAALVIGMQAIEYTTHKDFLDEMHERGLEYLLRPESNVDSQNGNP
jgi:putative hydrolase of the HAD superfamily